MFVQFVSNLTTGGQKLVVYDGYRAHMTLRVLQLFGSLGIIEYDLTETTLGKTKACDVVLFS